MDRSVLRVGAERAVRKGTVDSRRWPSAVRWSAGARSDTSPRRPMRTAQFGWTTTVPHSHVGLHFAMARAVASMSFRPRRDVGSMRGARSPILESMKWAVQVRRAATTMRRHVHFISDVFRQRPENQKENWAGHSSERAVDDDDDELRNKKTPTPCLWQAPASTQKTKRKTRPAIAMCVCRC